MEKEELRKKLLRNPDYFVDERKNKFSVFIDGKFYTFPYNIEELQKVLTHMNEEALPFLQQYHAAYDKE